MADKDAKTEKDAEPAADGPAWKGSMSSKEPLVGPDGHVHLSQEDIDARD
jgi:hypothetical protein